MIMLQPPPFRIYLLRHARAGWAKPGESDFARALDDTGYAEAEMIADRAMDKGYRPDILIASTALRCRQTADAIRRTWGDELETSYVDGLYNGAAQIYLELISAQKSASSVMLVGHNPTMEDVLSGFIGAEAFGEALPEGYPTCGLAVLDPPDSQDGYWRLSDFLDP